MADYNTSSLIDSIIQQSKDSEFSRSLVLEYVQRTQDSVLGRQRFRFLDSTLEAILSQEDVIFEYECDQQEIIRVVLIDESTDKPTVYTPDYISPDEFFDLYPSPDIKTPSSPLNYTDFNGELVFSSPLDRDYLLKMQYVARPKRLEDSTTDCPQIPVEYKDILTKGGLKGIEQFRENFDIAALYERDIEDLTDDMMSRYGLRKIGPSKSRTRGMSYNTRPFYNVSARNGTF